MTSNQPVCVRCDASSDTVPLVAFQFKGKEYWICPQHLPLLIHDPVKLADKLPGAELLKKHDH